MMNILKIVAAVIAAYLLGSINFAVIFSNLFLKKDVRKMGSGNAGATNVMRTAGVLPGVLTFLGDTLKGYAGAYIGKIVFENVYKATESPFLLPIYGAYICGIACMLGHVLPVFFQFKGGKGVATGVGAFFVCSPISAITGLTVFAVFTIITKIVSLSSIIATSVVVILSMILRDTSAMFLPQAILSILLGSIIIYKHKGNIARLIAGTETKIGGRKK